MKNRKIFVACGSGNNGGDGFVAARHLARWGYEVSVGLIKPADSLKGDSLTNFRLLRHSFRCNPFLLDDSMSSHMFADCILIIDALFGTGLNGPLRGVGRKLVTLINEASIPVVAADIPSGLNGDNGTVSSGSDGSKVAVKAHKTVTMGLPKTGFFSCEARSNLGELIVADIGFPENELLNQKEEPFCELCLASDVARMLPKRLADGHKGTFGRVLVVGGSRGMAGAIVMSARAALKAGAGLVTAAVPESIRSEVAAMVPEVMTVPLSEENGAISKDAVKTVVNSPFRADVILLGPGMGRADTTMEFVKELLNKLDCPVVVDADALYPEKLSMALRFRAKPTILTPHSGEAARILSQLGSSDGNSDGRNTDERGFWQRKKVAGLISRSCDAITVLKGPYTLTADSDGNCTINPTGNPGMATAGSGDVLAGVLASLVGQYFAGKAREEAAVSDTKDFGSGGNDGSSYSVADLRRIAASAAYLHGLAGDLCAAEYSEYSVTAPSISDFLSQAFKMVAAVGASSEDKAYPALIRYDRIKFVR